ncbi:fibronectin type III domain-containing protein [Streptomyces sp. DH24]|uniref:fibronectin type III domain-containing protein n=1 Tax=Streptomyces sp. DH24 TaxID=3040123 RepID=UPI0024436BA0|nr:fibronectin type III domain-containing protein [Streptomyces sp. DH24]MDG9717921.1 fibronectin type III domain-containing protein [Streptomyces sp. DH24]
MRRTARLAAPAVLLLALPACTTPQTGAPAEPDRPLRATLTTPTDIDLTWEDDHAGHVLEFATDEAGPYTVLRYLPAGVTGHRHPDLMPRTTFHYRLRAYRGPASEPVRVDLPGRGAPAADDEAWLAPRTEPGRQGAGRPLTHPAGVPSGFTADVRAADGIRFRWTDNSTDEDGFLLEIRRTRGTPFEPVAVLDPDVNSTGLITLPGEEHASYRVRGFTLGERSNVVRLTTGG